MRENFHARSLAPLEKAGGFGMTPSGNIIAIDKR